MTRRSRYLRPSWVVTPLILLFFYLALDSMVEDSPTMDEQNHVARGLAFLRTGDPRLSMEHPPLVNALSALPLLTMPEIRLPIDHPSWERPEGWYEFADLLLWSYNDDATRIVFLARIPIIFLTLGLALIGYRFASQLWGRRAALLAFSLLLFDPNILAHGRYSTTDAGGTTFLFLATLLLWRLWSWDKWSWSKLAQAGVGLGLAFGSKLSTLAFVPIFTVMAFVPVYKGHTQRAYWQRVGQRLLELGAAGLISIVTLWVIFGFEWGPFHFKSDLLEFMNELHGPIPTYWAGVEQIAGFTGRGRGEAFLLGQFSANGFLAYFPVAFVSKTPLPILLLLPIAATVLLKNREKRGDAVFLLLPSLLYFLISLQSSLNIGYRHLLPMLPFLLVLISGLAEWAGAKKGDVLATDHLFANCRLLTIGFYALIAGVLFSDFLIHPHYLSYFNIAAGGPENGYNILVDSNIDWGQDLIRLKDWMAETGVEEVNLAWFGSADPQHYGMRYRPLPGVGRAEFFPLWWDVPFDRTNPASGVYAISASNLWELPLREEEKNVFAWFRARQPDHRIGYSILIYEIP